MPAGLRFLYRPLTVVFMLILCMQLTAVGFAETERGDLNERFSDEITVTYSDTLYRKKSRVDSVLFVGFAADESGAVYRPEMLIILTVDDNLKLITPVWMDKALLPEDNEIPRNSDFEFTGQNDITSECEEILEMVNGLLPAELIEHYVAIDLASLKLLDGLDTPDYLDWMRAIKDRIEQTSSEQLDDIFDKMSGQIVSDLKSGGLIKLVDKAERYERVSMLRFVADADDGMSDDEDILYSEEAMLEKTIGVFFEEKELW